jgi:hypothetical protein
MTVGMELWLFCTSRVGLPCVCVCVVNMRLPTSRAVALVKPHYLHKMVHLGSTIQHHILELLPHDHPLHSCHGLFLTLLTPRTFEFAA